MELIHEQLLIIPICRMSIHLLGPILGTFAES